MKERRKLARNITRYRCYKRDGNLKSFHRDWDDYCRSGVFETTSDKKPHGFKKLLSKINFKKKGN